MISFLLCLFLLCQYHHHCSPPPQPQSLLPPPSHWVAIAATVKPTVNNFCREAAATLIIPSSSPTIGHFRPLPSKPSPIHLSPMIVDCCVKPTSRLLHCCCSQRQEVVPVRRCRRPSLSIFVICHSCHCLIVSLPFYCTSSRMTPPPA